MKSQQTDPLHSKDTQTRNSDNADNSYENRREEIIYNLYNVTIICSERVFPLQENAVAARYEKYSSQQYVQ